MAYTIAPTYGRLRVNYSAMPADLAYFKGGPDSYLTMSCRCKCKFSTVDDGSAFLRLGPQPGIFAPRGGQFFIGNIVRWIRSFWIAMNSGSRDFYIIDN